MMYYEHWINIFLQITILSKKCLTVMFAPSFVSDWHKATAGNINLSLLTIDHNLGEYPVKVDVQVKIVERIGEYIFTGLGSSQRDDDFNISSGGVVYKYNQRHVIVSFPFQNNHYGSMGLAYTGSDSLYYGPTYLLGPYITGFVRVRVWIAADMPQLVLNTSTSMSSSDNYREINHTLGFYPDMVTVHTLIDNGYMSDGIGVVFVANGSNMFNSLGGVLFGYDETKIRLWVPSTLNNTGGGVFFADDGYALGYKNKGTIIILGWRMDCSTQVFYKELTVEKNVSHSHTFKLPSSYDLSNYFVSVQYKVQDRDGPNSGMMFNGAGTTQAMHPFNYGGIIYVYNETEIMIWRPQNTTVYIGERWGSGRSPQISYKSDIIIRVFHLAEAECPYPEAAGNATFQTSGLKYGDLVNYTCNAGYYHYGGQLKRSCGRDRRWSGVGPVCVALFGWVANVTNTGNSSSTLEQILESISVKKSTTSSYKRRHTSATDNRTSAVSLGILGLSVLAFVCLCLVLPDLCTLCTKIDISWQTNRRKGD